MDDIDTTSREYGMTVNGYVNLLRSPHVLSKKVIDLDLNKEADDTYPARIGFNVNLITVGKYTMVIEWLFPDSDGMNSSTVNFRPWVASQFIKLNSLRASSPGGRAVGEDQLPSPSPPRELEGRKFDYRDEDH